MTPVQEVEREGDRDLSELATPSAARNDAIKMFS